LKLPLRGAVIEPRPRRSSEALGVGNRSLIVWVRWDFSGWATNPIESFQSRAAGVGSNWTSIVRGVNVGVPGRNLRSLSWYCSTVPPGSFAHGVGSNDEDALSSVAGAHVRSSHASPARVIPERGQVTKDRFDRCRSPPSSVSPGNKEGVDVFHDDVSGSKNANTFRDVFPYPSLIPGHLPLAGTAHGRAGEPRAHNVHGVNVGPVDRGDVAQVGDVRVVVGEHFGRPLVVLGVPGDVGPEDVGDAHLEAPVAGAERTDHWGLGTSCGHDTMSPRW
jgi:hypothetical protein